MNVSPEDYLRSLRTKPHRAQRFWVRCLPEDAHALNQARKFLQLTWPQFWHYQVLQLRRQVPT
jgi:hypothetical protein